MCTEVNNEVLQSWFEKLTGDKLSQIVKEDLKQFLESLLENFSHSKINETLTGALPKLSKLGPLLEALSKCNAVNLDKDLYTLTMRCVLQLLVDNPDNVVKEKAASFARTQLRQTASYYKQGDPCSNLAHYVGCSPDQYNAESCTKLMIEVGDRLQSRGHRWKCIDGFMLQGRSMPSEVLTELSLKCLPLLKIPGSHHIIEALLVCHPCSIPHEPLHRDFLKAIIRTQQNAYSDIQCDLSLSYSGQIALWDRYLPALEEEVMSLLRNLCQPWMTRHQCIERISSRHLPQACLEHPSIYSVVDNLLQAALEKSMGGPQIFRITVCFHQAILQCANDPIKQKKSVGICSLYPLRYRSLLNLLIVSPHDLSNKSCCLHLTHIDRILIESAHELNPKDWYELWLVLIKWPTWYYKAVEMILVSDWSQTPHGIQLMCWFNYPGHEEKHGRFEELVSSFGRTFRRLINQSYLQIKDLRDSILANQHPEYSHMTNIIQPMCQLLVVHSKEGFRRMQQIVSLALEMDEGPSTIEQLRFTLDAVDLYQQLNGSRLIPQSKLIKDHIQGLKKACVDGLRGSGVLDRTALRRKTECILMCCNDVEDYLILSGQS